MLIQPVDQLPVAIHTPDGDTYWQLVRDILDTSPGIWHLAIRNTRNGPRTVAAVNADAHPTLPGHSYAAYCHTRQEGDGRYKRLVHDVYLRRRPTISAVSSTPTA